MRVNPIQNISFKAANLVIQRPPEGTPEREYVDRRLGLNLDKPNDTVQHLRSGIDKLAQNAQILPDGELQLRINKNICLQEDSICGGKLEKALLAARRKIGLAPDYTKKEGLAYELTYTPGPQATRIIGANTWMLTKEEKPDYHVTDYMVKIPDHAEYIARQYQERLERQQERQRSIAQSTPIDNFLPTQGVKKGFIPEQTVIAMLQEDGMPKQEVQQICTATNQEIRQDMDYGQTIGTLKALQRR